MRTIAIVTPSYSPATGGLEQHVERLAQGLAALGLPIDVLTTARQARSTIETHDGITVRRFPRRGAGIYFIAPSLSRWLRENSARYGLVHAHSYHTPVALQAAMAIPALTPFVLTPHYHATGHTPLARMLHPLYRSAGRRMVRRASTVICVSQAEADLIERDFGSTPTVVIPNGVDPFPFQDAAPRPHQAGRLVLAVGRLESYKRVDRLLAALPWLGTDHQVVIVGQGPDRPRLEKLARRQGDEQRVLFTGRIEEPELRSWYRAAGVVAALSEHEAFGMTLLEAAAAGARVLASDIPAHREVATNLSCVRLIGAEADARAIAATILELERMPPPEPATLPSWAAAAEATASLYRRLLQSGVAVTAVRA